MQSQALMAITDTAGPVTHLFFSALFCSLPDSDMLEVLGVISPGGVADVTVVAAAVAMIQVTFGGTLFV